MMDGEIDMMAEMPVVLSVVFESVPGREDELLTHLSALVTPTRNEEGCEVYELHKDPAAPGKFFFYERFKDEAALDAHVNSSYFQEFVAYRATERDPVASVIVTRWSSV